MSSKIHTLFNAALHPDQAQPKLVFQEFAHGTHATIAQVIDIVDFPLADLEIDEIADDFHNVLSGQSSLFERQVQDKLLIQL